MKVSASLDPAGIQQAKAVKANGEVLFRGKAQPVDTLSIRFGNVQAVGEKDYLADIRREGVVVVGGGGTMGADIALTHLNGNVPVYIQDRDEAATARGEANIRNGLDNAVERGLVSVGEAADRFALLKGKLTDTTQVPTSPAPAFVIEAVFENYAVKEGIFRDMNAHLPPETILATNTSSLSVDRLAEASGRPDRFIGLHFFLPAYKNRLVEIIPGSKTSPETVEKTKALVRAIGKIPIVCQDSPGFGVNRMLVPVMNEGIRMLERLTEAKLKEYEAAHGPATPAVRELIERRMATTIEQAVKETLWPTFSKDPKAGALLVGPFSGLNSPIYMGIIGEITQSLHEGLGEGYRPADTIQSKSQAFYALRKENPPNFEERLARLQFKLGGPESLDQTLLPQLKEHLQGLIIGVAMQLQDQGVISPEDLHRGMALGTKWELMPYELINQLGAKRSLGLVEAYAKTNPAFAVPETLKALAANEGKIPLDYVQTRTEGSTRYVTINKPQRQNALDQAMLANIRKAFQAAEADPAVKTIVFESGGGAQFVSGADIFALKDQFKGMNPVQQLSVFRKLILQGKQLYDEIAGSSKVTVAKVDGQALGGGAELALACDYVVASEKASFGTPEVLYGIYPAWGGTERLPQKVGKTMARFMILEGGLMKRGKGPAILSGQDAAAIGLADRLANSATLDRELRDALAKGDFAAKPARDSRSAEERQQRRMAGFQPGQSHLADKFNRYSNAGLEDLLDQELALLAPPSAREVYQKVLALADERIRHADDRIGNRLRLERDIVRTSLNYLAVDKLQRSQKKAG